MHSWELEKQGAITTRGVNDMSNYTQKDCQHIWIPTDLNTRGEPVFSPNSQYPEPRITPVKCQECKETNEFTYDEWYSV